MNWEIHSKNQPVFEGTNSETHPKYHIISPNPDFFGHKIQPFTSISTSFHFHVHGRESRSVVDEIIILLVVESTSSSTKKGRPRWFHIFLAYL